MADISHQFQAHLREVSGWRQKLEAQYLCLQTTQAQADPLAVADQDQMLDVSVCLSRCSAYQTLQ